MGADVFECAQRTSLQYSRSPPAETSSYEETGFHATRASGELKPATATPNGVSSSRTPNMAPAPACAIPRRGYSAGSDTALAQPRHSPITAQAQPRPYGPLLDVGACVYPVERGAIARLLDEHNRTRAERAIVPVGVKRRDGLSDRGGLHGVGEDASDLPRTEVEGSDCRRLHIIREEDGVGGLDTGHA